MAEDTCPLPQPPDACGSLRLIGDLEALSLVFFVSELASELDIVTPLDWKGLRSFPGDRYPSFPCFHFPQPSLRPAAGPSLSMTLEQQEPHLHRASAPAPIKPLPPSLVGPLPPHIQRSVAREAFSEWWQSATSGTEGRQPAISPGLTTAAIAKQAWDAAVLATQYAAIDRSDAADAARLRWMLSGHGYFMEESGLCGVAPCSQREQDDARLQIDARMAGND